MSRAFRIVQVPKPLAVGADYGLAVIKGARPDILAKHGFTATALRPSSKPRTSSWVRNSSML